MKTLLCLLVLIWPVVATATVTCDSWKIEAYCCPGACIAVKSVSPQNGDNALRGCMLAFGCAPEETGHATVFQMCRCNK